MDKKLHIIGSNERISIGQRAVDVLAKIDTGADTSSIWASHIRVGKDGILRFRLFDEGSKYYTGKVYKRKDYKVAVVRSAMGHEQIRYRTHFTITLAGRKIRVLFNLSDRSKNNYKVLIGRRTIAGKFVVDVSKKVVSYPKIAQTKKLNEKLQNDPHAFHKEYVNNHKHSRRKGDKIERGI